VERQRLSDAEYDEAVKVLIGTMTRLALAVKWHAQLAEAETSLPLPAEASTCE